MKKILLTLVAIMAISTFASAQLYVGGTVGVNTAGGKTKALDGVETAKPKTFGFQIAPNIGYSLDNNLSLGAKLDINYFKNTDNLDWNSTTTFGITPYMRYAFFTVGKFQVNLEAGFGLAFGSNKYKDMPSSEKNSISVFNVYAVPVLTYGLTKNITLETTLHFCNLGYESRTNTTKDGDDKSTDSTNRFRLGANTGDAFNIGNITVGFTYKF
jgi:hypothetical protein